MFACPPYNDDYFQLLFAANLIVSKVEVKDCINLSFVYGTNECALHCVRSNDMSKINSNNNKNVRYEHRKTLFSFLLSQLSSVSVV